MEVLKINLVGYWKYSNITNEDCTICHNSIYESSTINKNKGKESYLTVGTCNHGFHNECINPWLILNYRCPICFTEWKK
jgi:hypothetical protein